jgi:hypothetical protein
VSALARKKAWPDADMLNAMLPAPKKIGAAFTLKPSLNLNGL